MMIILMIYRNIVPFIMDVIIINTIIITIMIIIITLIIITIIIITLRSINSYTFILSQDKRDPLLLKIIRNISLWTFKQQEELENPELQYKYRGLWSPHIKLLIEILKDDDSSHDVQIEIFGCLANMTMYDLPATSNWKKLMRDYNLLNLFCKMLVPGMQLKCYVMMMLMMMMMIIIIIITMMMMMMEMMMSQRSCVIIITNDDND